MTNLFESTTAANILSRLDKLQPGSQGQWGKMNVSQMMAHCCAPLESYFGDVKLKRGLMGILFGKIAKKKLFTDKPWPKSLPTSKDFMIADEKNFQNEKARLVILIQRFSTEGDNAKVSVHPFFGKMTSQEWAILQYKHLNHHLQQFGA